MINRISLIFIWKEDMIMDIKDLKNLKKGDFVLAQGRYSNLKRNHG